MKMFTKLALVSSMAISANAMAMQSMDDAALSATTGQDGINIGLGISRVTIEKVLIHDNDGLRTGGTVVADPGTVFADQTALDTWNNNPANASNQKIITDIDPRTVVLGVTGSTGGTGKAGAIVVNNVAITANAAALLPSHNLADIVIDTDAGTGANGAFLNVAAKVSGLNISVGEIGVSASGTAGTTNIRRGHSATNYNAILSGLTIKTGTMDANVQLGAVPQGAMIKLSTTMTGGLEIANLGIYDSSTIGQNVGYTAGPDSILGTVDDVAVNSTLKGEIRIDSIKVADANGPNLTVNADVSVVGESAAGAKNGYLKISAMNTASDMYVKGVHLGSATAGSIGDIEVQNMQVFNGAAGTTAGAIIKISGH